MRRWLIDLPAAAVDLWFTAYRYLLTATTIIAVSLVVLMLAAAILGVRIGW